MIVTVTLNPALDKTYTTSNLIKGQVNRMDSVTLIPGGKGINVARVLREFDYEVVTTGFLGGYTGDFIETSLKNHQIPTQFVKIQGETRTNSNIVGEDGYITEILEPGCEISKEEAQLFMNQYGILCKNCSLVVLSGSVIQGMPKDIYASLIKIAKENHQKVLLDSSGQFFVQGLRELPYLVKPNIKELEFAVGKRLENMSSIAEAARLLQQRGIKKVVVSLGEKGILYVDRDVCMRGSVSNIRKVNTVGCGDSVVASYAMSILAEDSIEAALRQGVAISAAHSMTMENGTVDKTMVDEIKERVKLEIVN